MSCNHCATSSTAAAAAAGAPDIEAARADSLGHPQYCPTCHAFLRADGGCTRCENTGVTSDGGILAMAAPASTPHPAPPPWNVVNIDQFTKDVDAELKRRAQPGLSDAEAADWYESVNLVTSLGYSPQAGSVANGVSLARSDQAKLMAVLAEASNQLEEMPLTDWETEDLRQMLQGRANVGWLKGKPAEIHSPEDIADMAAALRELRVTDLFNKVDLSLPPFGGLTPQEKTTWRNYAVSSRQADPQQLRDLVLAARQMAEGGSDVPALTRACGHAHTTGEGPGELTWCTGCDDWTIVLAPAPPAAEAAPSVIKPDTPASPPAPDEPQTAYGQAAYATQHDKTKRPAAQAKVKAIGYRLAAALAGVGVPPGTTPDTIYNMVWQYLDRCDCGAWISPRTPVCRNPRCGQKGKEVGEARPWPPHNVAWVQRKQDVGFEVGHPAAPHPAPPPKPGKTPGAITSAAPTPATPVPPVTATSAPASTPATPPVVASPTPAELTAYEAELETLAKGYGLDAGDFLKDDLAEQVASGETPAELVERIAEKYDLTPIGDTSAAAWGVVINDDLDEGGSDEAVPDVYQRVYFNRVDFNTPSLREVEKAFETINSQIANETGFSIHWVREKIRHEVTFSEPVTLSRHSRPPVTTDRAVVKLFEGEYGGLGYTFYQRSGYEVDREMAEKITGIRPLRYLSRDQQRALKAEKAAEVTALSRLVHPNAWPQERKLMFTRPTKYANYGTERVSMRQVFGESVVRELEKAFRDGQDFSYQLPGDKRTRSVDVRRQPDGSVKAWFTSTPTGSFNGDNYLLLNPFTASLKNID